MQLRFDVYSICYMHTTYNSTMHIVRRIPSNLTHIIKIIIYSPCHMAKKYSQFPCWSMEHSLRANVHNFNTGLVKEGTFHLIIK